MRLLWLPQVLRDAGLEVEEVDGWQTRGNSSFDPTGGICHGTGGSKTSNDSGELHVILNGSATAPPPIAQLMLNRSGKFYVVASGRCNHILTRGGIGNTQRIGIEAMNNNTDERYSTEQYRAYVVGCAAIERKMVSLGRRWDGWKGHKEHQSEKIDPNFDMAEFRFLISRELRRGSAPVTDIRRPTMYAIVQVESNPSVWLAERSVDSNGTAVASLTPIHSESVAKNLVVLGANNAKANPYYGNANGRPFVSEKEMKETVFAGIEGA